MAAKQLAFADDARAKLLSGASKLAKAVRSTLGPRGRNAILDKGWGSPTITKDGVSVAEEIELSDPFENMGAQLIKEAASKTSDVAGDGTTTATVLAEFIFREGLKSVAAGSDPMAIVRGIQVGVEKVTAELAKLAEKIDPKNNKAIAEVATIAANNDKEIGQKLAEAMKLVGAANGVITIEEGKTADTEINVVQGMQFDRGYLSPHFVNNPESVTVEFDNPLILIYEEKISNVKDLVPLLEKASQQKSPLVIIAEDVEGEALATLVLNKLKGVLTVAAVKAPGYGDRRKAMMEDIAVLTGGKAIFEDLGVQLEKVELADLGRAKKVKIDKDNTVVIEGAGKKDAIKARAAQIQKELDKSTSDYDKEKLSERMAKLQGGVAKINVGGATESEVKEKKMRVEDAMFATRAANQEGILPGGGVALLRASQGIKPEGLTDDEVVGFNIIVRACKAPIRQIVENAGGDGSVVTAEVLKNPSATFGYDARAGEYTDLVKKGVIDPAKVVRSALQNAASVATLLLTSDALVADMPKDDKKSPAGGGGGYDDMY